MGSSRRLLIDGGLLADRGPLAGHGLLAGRGLRTGGGLRRRGGRLLLLPAPRHRAKTAVKSRLAG